MNELNNVVTAVGNYDNVSTSLSSNVSTVNLVSGLSITKDADKKYWSGGDLTYTITLDNQTDRDYVNPVITDVIDTNLVSFVSDSVMVNGVAFDKSKYSYDDSTHTLTVNLDTVSANSTTTLTFQVEKKTQ